MSYTLLVKNVDGAYVSGVWDKKPTEDELRYEVGGMWEDADEQELINQLLVQGHHDMEDSACTSYELSQQ